MAHSLILLHGALGSREQWTPFLPLLEAQFDVHVLDFPGHGASPGGDTPFRIENFAKHVASYIEQHALGATDVFGYSMGGYVALHLARTRPALIRRVMTLATKFDWSPESAAKETSRLNPTVLAKKVPAFVETLRLRHSASGWESVVRSTAEMMTGLGTAPLLRDENVVEITQPVRVMVGSWDTMVSVEESQHVASLLPRGEFHLLYDTPHPLESVDPAVLTAEIKGFFVPSMAATI